MSYIEELKELGKLKEDGILTEEEFRQKKEEILSQGSQIETSSISQPKQDDKLDMNEEEHYEEGYEEDLEKQLNIILNLKEKGVFTEEEYQKEKIEMIEILSKLYKVEPKSQPKEDDKPKEKLGFFGKLMKKGLNKRIKKTLDVIVDDPELKKATLAYEASAKRLKKATEKAAKAHKDAWKNSPALR